MKSFFKSIAKFFDNLFTNQTWQSKAKVVLATLATAAEGILEVTGNGEDVVITQAVVTEVNNGFATISSLVDNYDQAPATFKGKILAVLDGIKTNLSSLLAEGGIKNTATAAKVSGLVGIIVSDADLFAGLLPTPATPATPVAG